MGKFRKKKVIVSILIGLAIIGGVGYISLDKLEEAQKTEEKGKAVAMFVQDNEGNYQTSQSREFPKEGYVLNLEKSFCKNGGILSQDSVTKAISLKVSHADACNLYFDKEIQKTGEEALKILKLQSQSGPSSFASSATIDETKDSLFAMEDDYGTSYYYRGTAPNNYIKFGKDASGQEMWWRIIRFNGDGSIRMQYDGAGTSGATTYTKGFALTSQPWNYKSDDAKYVGWMFWGANGTASTSKEQAQRNETSSPIKIAVDNWYKTNIYDTGYSTYVEDAIFCNDRSTPGQSATGWSSDTALGYGKNATAYGAVAREGFSETKNHENPKPTFVCPQDNDKFTVSEEKGNGVLTYPVGLITADEIVAAGSGKYNTTNSDYYLKKDNWYWSFSPCYMYSEYARVFGVYSGGYLYDY